MKENEQRKKSKKEEKMYIQFFNLCYVIFRSTTSAPTFLSNI